MLDDTHARLCVQSSVFKQGSRKGQGRETDYEKGTETPTLRNILEPAFANHSGDEFAKFQTLMLDKTHPEARIQAENFTALLLSTELFHLAFTASSQPGHSLGDCS